MLAFLYLLGLISLLKKAHWDNRGILQKSIGWTSKIINASSGVLIAPNELQAKIACPSY